MIKILKLLGKVLTTIMNAVLSLLLFLLLTPIVYFAWRAGQPMSMPEYDGRTYYELLAERRQAYNHLAQEYQASHPDVDVKIGMCDQSEVLMIAYNMPWAGFCSMAGFAAGVNNMAGPNARHLGCGIQDSTLITILPNWWNMYERLTFELMSHTRSGPVSYCRISTP